MQTVRPAALAAGFLAAVASLAAWASGLQVSPVSLTLGPDEQAKALWLSNTGDAALHAQVRVFDWSQQGGEDLLTPTRDLVASPPMLELEPGQRQLIRVVRPASPGTAAPRFYRLLVNELPVQDREGSGVEFVMEYSLPVFATPETAAPAQLSWSLAGDGVDRKLRVENTGGTHAQLSDLRVVDAGAGQEVVAEGLLGYVLPGSTMEWTVPPAAAGLLVSGGSLQARINGQMVTPIEVVHTAD